MQESMYMESGGSMAANARNGESRPLLTIAEFASIICTVSKEVFWASSAAERRKVQWRGLPMQRKGPPVQWKATPSAAESYTSHLHSAIVNQRIVCSL